MAQNNECGVERIVLYLDHSPDSDELRNCVERQGIPYIAIYQPPSDEVPAIEMIHGTFRGIDNIRRYFDLKA
jgi:hypothetical protein